MNAWNRKLTLIDKVWLIYYAMIFIFSCAINNAQMMSTICIFGICCLRQLRKRRGKVPKIKASDNAFWYGLFYVFVVLSWLWTSGVGKTYSNMITTLIQILVFLVCLDLSIQDLDTAIVHVRCYCYASLLFALVLLLTSPPSTYNSLEFGGITGMHRNTSGYLMMMATYFDLFVMTKVSRRKKKTYLLMAVISFITSLLSGSRKIIVGYAIMLIAWSIMQKNIKKSLKILLLVVGGAIVLIPIAYQISYIQNAFGLRMAAVFDDSIADGSIEARNRARLLALELFRAKPVLGNGWNAVVSMYGYYFGRSGGIYAHNNYLEVAADFGIVGLVLFYWKYVKNIIYSFKGYKRSTLLRFSCICLATILVLDWGQVTYLYLYEMIIYAILFKFIQYIRKEEG